MANSILLLGANDRACFSVARNLKKHSYEVVVASWEQHPVSHSRYINDFYRLPHLHSNIEEFYTAFRKLVSDRKFWLVLPINDMAVEFLSQYKEELMPLITVGGINPPDIIKYSRDKYALWGISKNLGMHVPETVFVSSLEEFQKIKINLRYPVIAKPISSKKVYKNKIYSFTVRSLQTEMEVEDFVRERILVIPVMLQQQVKGFGIGFNFLAQQGKLIAYYMHERIHEPGGGGESSYRKTLVDDKYNIVEHATQLISKTGWDGVGMIEYKVHDSKPYVMELNGRFWGSIELGIFAGIEIPYWQIAYNYEGKKLPEQPISCKKEVFARNLRNDIFNVVRHRSASRIKNWTLSLPNMFRANEKIEDSLFNDPVFRFLTWTELLGKLFSSKWRTLQRKFMAVKSGSQQRLNNLHSVLFVCEGNICRSPFAEGYLKKIRPDLRVCSCGFQFQSSKLSPLNALHAADRFQVDLSLHESVFIGDIDLKVVDIIVVMDRNNFQKLLRDYPDESGKVIFLGDNREIADPYGRAEGDFVTCYSKIKTAIDRLFVK